MKTLGVEGNLAKKEASKTKPILVQKKPYLKKESERYELYKKKIENKKYLEFAIDEIAIELTHFLSKQ